MQTWTKRSYVIFHNRHFENMNNNYIVGPHVIGNLNNDKFNSVNQTHTKVY